MSQRRSLTFLTLVAHVIDPRDEIYFEGTFAWELKASMNRAIDHCLEVCDARTAAHNPAAL